jgi:hypothetical protein
VVFYFTRKAPSKYSLVEFTIEMSAEALGTKRPVLVKCQGPGCAMFQGCLRQRVAVAIDGYQSVLALMIEGASFPMSMATSIPDREGGKLMWRAS